MSVEFRLYRGREARGDSCGCMLDSISHLSRGKCSHMARKKYELAVVMSHFDSQWHLCPP